MPLALSRVTSDDFNTLLPIQFAAFANNGAHNAQLGFNNAENIAHAKTIFLETFTSDPADVWLKVTDEDANGKIIAASNWKIYPTYVKSAFDTKTAALEKLEVEDITWHSDARQKEDAATIIKEFFATRYRRTREAHVLLDILYTDPEYHGRGAGKMMVQWGNALADQLMLPCWVEASPEGYRLYSSCGYEDVEKKYRQTESLALPMDYMVMRRPLKVTKLEGKALERR